MSDDDQDDFFRLLFAKGSDTSEEAAESVQEVTGRLRKMVFAFIAQRGEHGATCDEVEDVLDLRHQTASARVYELHKQGAIVDSEKRRLTRSGRRAAVWITQEKQHVPIESLDPGGAALSLPGLGG